MKPLLVSKFKNCLYCKAFLFRSQELKDDIMFYCSSCQNHTPWIHQTALQKSFLTYSQIEIMIWLYLENKSPKEVQSEILRITTN